MTHLFTSRRDREQWERQKERQNAEWARQRQDKLADVRAQVYLDLMEFSQNLTLILDIDLDSEERDALPDQMSDLLHPARLSARIRLYLDEDVLAAWWRVANSYASVREAAKDIDSLEAMPRDVIKRASEAVEVLQSLLRSRVHEPS